MNKSKIYSLEMLRAIAYTAIFISHAYNCGIFIGSWGVSVFLVLSGFVLTYTYWDRNVDSSFKGCLSFAKKSISKLYPLHIVMLALAVLIKAPAIIKHRALDMLFGILKQAILDILMVQSYIPVSSFYNALNGVSWYLSVVLITSFIFPLLIMGLRKIKTIKSGVLIAFVVCAVQALAIYVISTLKTPSYFTGYQKWATYRFPLVRIPDFIMGGVMASIYRMIDKNKLNTISCTVFEFIAVVLNIVVLMLYPLSDRTEAMWYDRTVIFLLPSAVLIMAFAMDKRKLSSTINDNILVRIGYYSRYTFLIHQVVIMYFCTLQGAIYSGNNTIITHCSALLSYALALVLAVCWDKYFKTGIDRAKNI